MGKLVFQVTGAFAEFERSMIRQRVKLGLKRAIAKGVKLGRPKVDRAIERKIERQLAKGTGILKTAKLLGIGTSTVQRIKAQTAPFCDGSRVGMTSLSVHPHMLRHACGFKLANDGHDTRALQHYLGHKNIQHTVRYTELSPARFRDFWKD